MTLSTIFMAEGMSLNFDDFIAGDMASELSSTLLMFVMPVLGVLVIWLVFKLVMGAAYGRGRSSYYYSYRVPKESSANNTLNDKPSNSVVKTAVDVSPSALESHNAHIIESALENPIIDYMDADYGYGAENDVFYDGDINISDTNIDPVKKALFDDYKDEAVSSEIDKLLLRIDKVEKKIQNDNSILFEYRCPSCGQAYQCDDDYEGFIPHCLNCNSILAKQQVYKLK